MPDRFLGRYVSLGFLGKGSMGQVWLAHPLGQPDQRVVVKVMQPTVAHQPRFRELFEREIQSMAKLRHPYIVRLVDFSANDPAGPCLVMEYVPGVTLEAVLEKQKRLPVGHVGLLLGFICHALEAAHRVGIIHRDLKPANLMVINPGTVDQSLRVMDFGLAQLANKPHISAERLAGARQVSTSGTPSYISPEALRGDGVDPRADIYSLGVVLFQLLTGQLPFPHDDVTRMLSAHVHERPLTFGLAGTWDVPKGVEAVVQRCLSKYAVERPQTAREVAALFSEAIDLDIWEAVNGEGVPDTSGPVQPIKAAAVLDPNAIVHHLDAWMPECIAVVKLRGFLEDLGGKVMASEPGLLRIRLGQPIPSRSGRVILSKLKDQHPVEIELRMEKPDPRDNHLNVTVLFRSYSDPVLLQLPDWRNRCQILYKELQSYLMAR